MKLQIIKELKNPSDFCEYISKHYDLKSFDCDGSTNTCNIEISNDVSEEDMFLVIDSYVPSEQSYIYAPQIFPITKIKSLGDGIFSSVFSWSFTGTNLDGTCGIQLKLDAPCNIRILDVTNVNLIAYQEFRSLESECVNVLYDTTNLPQKPAIFELSIACTNSSPQTIISLFSFISKFL